MTFVPKAWQNDAVGGTKLDAAALVDLETRLSAYTDANPAGGGDTVLCAAPTGVAATDNANFQAGLTAAAGGTLQLRDGTYNLTTAMSVPSATTIQGDRATIVNCTVSGVMFDFTSKNGIALRGGYYNLLGTSSTWMRFSGTFGCTLDGVQVWGTHTLAVPQAGEVGLDFTNNSGDNWIIGGCEFGKLGIGIRTGSYANFLTHAKITNCQYGVVAVNSFASGMVISNCSLASTPGGTTLSQIYIPHAAGYFLIENTDMEGANDTVVVGSGTHFDGPTHFSITSSHLAGTNTILNIQSAYGCSLVGISFTADPTTTPTTLTINPTGAPDNGFAAGLITNVLADSDTIPASVFPAAWTYFGRTQSQWPGLSSIVSNAWGPSDHGLIAWSYDPSLAAGATIVATGGTICTVRLKLAVAASITKVCLYCTTTSSLTSGQCFAAIYQGGALVGVTADQSGVWNTAGFKAMTLVGGPFSVTSGDVIVAFFANGGPLPTFARAAQLGVGNVNLTLANSRYGTADTGQTTSMPGTLGTIGASSADYWAAVA